MKKWDIKRAGRAAPVPVRGENTARVRGCGPRAVWSIFPSGQLRSGAPENARTAVWADLGGCGALRLGRSGQNGRASGKIARRRVVLLLRNGPLYATIFYHYGIWVVRNRRAVSAKRDDLIAKHPADGVRYTESVVCLENRTAREQSTKMDWSAGAVRIAPPQHRNPWKRRRYRKLWN